jgi:hypothetical protein
MGEASKIETGGQNKADDQPGGGFDNDNSQQRSHGSKSEWPTELCLNSACRRNGSEVQAGALFGLGSFHCSLNYQDLNLGRMRRSCNRCTSARQIGLPRKK